MEKFAGPLNFEMEETLCFGVERKWGKYNVPIEVTDEIKEELDNLSKTHSTKRCVYGERTKFSCVGVYTNKDSYRYLVLKLTKLKRCGKEVELEVAED